MTGLLYVYLTRWDADLVRRQRQISPTRAIVLAQAERQRDVVAACCDLADGAGVHRGMTVAHARALVPEAHIEPIDRALHDRLLRRLARRMHRLVPIVAMDAPDGLLLDARGCEGIYGSIGQLISSVRTHLQAMGLRARIAAAPTWAAARALARFGPCDESVTTAPVLRRTLSTLPVEALGVDPDIVRRLARVGVVNIGQLMALPRTSLGARYGPDVLLRLDQALGDAIETIEPVHAHEPIEAERMLEGPTDRLDDIMLVVRDVLETLTAQLHRRSLGGRWWEITLVRSDLDPLVLMIHTSRPSRDAAHVCALFRHRLDRLPLGFGVEGVRGRVRITARTRDEQQSAWEREHVKQARIGTLIDTMKARLGYGCVRRPALRGSHIPERAQVYERVDRLDTRGRAEAPLPAGDRPSILLRRPIPTDVSLLLPDGPIAQVRLEGRMVRVVRCIGPERIEGEWWRASMPGRDYFKVQAEDGRWVWIFRQVQTAQWFTHGQWG